MEKFLRQAPRWIRLRYICIVSREDPDFQELVDMAHGFGFDVYQYRNLPLGQKMNAGIYTAINHYHPDYVMNMGSDDLCDVSIWKVYKEYIEAGKELIGIDSCFIIEHKTHQAFYLDLYNEQWPVGVLRLIKVSTIERLKTAYKLNLYYAEINQGMDTASMMRLMKIGVTPTVIHTDWRPFTAGIKGNVTINHWMHLSTLDRAKEVDFETIKHLMP